MLGNLEDFTLENPSLLLIMDAGGKNWAIGVPLYQVDLQDWYAGLCNTHKI